MRKAAWSREAAPSKSEGSSSLRSSQLRYLPPHPPQSIAQNKAFWQQDTAGWKMLLAAFFFFCLCGWPTIAMALMAIWTPLKYLPLGLTDDSGWMTQGPSTKPWRTVKGVSHDVLICVWLVFYSFIQFLDSLSSSRRLDTVAPACSSKFLV